MSDPLSMAARILRAYQTDHAYQGNSCRDRTGNCLCPICSESRKWMGIIFPNGLAKSNNNGKGGPKR